MTRPSKSVRSSSLIASSASEVCLKVTKAKPRCSRVRGSYTRRVSVTSPKWENLRCKSDSVVLVAMPLTYKLLPGFKEGLRERRGLGLLLLEGVRRGEREGVRRGEREGVRRGERLTEREGLRERETERDTDLRGLGERLDPIVCWVVCLCCFCGGGNAVSPLLSSVATSPSPR